MAKNGKTPDAQGNFASVNGIEIYYEDRGAGPPLVLVHAGAGTSNIWESYYDAFTQDYRVITPHNRGHGRTNNPSDTWNYPTMTDDIAALIQELGLEKPHLCGWSDGGQVGLDLAIRYPGIAGSYIVGAAWKDIEDSGIEKLHEIGFQSPGEVNFEQMEEAVPGFVERARTLHAPQGAEYWKSLMIGLSKLWMTPFNFGDEDLAAIQESVLFIIGDRDFIPLEAVLAMYRLVPNAELAVLPGADHYIPRTHPKEFSALVLDFLGRQPF